MDWVTELPTPPTHTRHTPMPTHTISNAQCRPHTSAPPSAHTVSKLQKLQTTPNTLPIITAVYGSTPAYANIGYEPTHIVNVVGHAIPTRQTIIPITPAVTTTTDSTTTTTTLTLNTTTNPAITYTNTTGTTGNNHTTRTDNTSHYNKTRSQNGFAGISTSGARSGYNAKPTYHCDTTHTTSETIQRYHKLANLSGSL